MRQKCHLSIAFAKLLQLRGLCMRSATQLRSGADASDGGEVVWSLELMQSLQAGLRAAAVSALNMAIIGAGMQWITTTLMICLQCCTT